MARFELAMWGPDLYGKKLCERIDELGPADFLGSFSATDNWGTLDPKVTDKEPGNDSVDVYREEQWTLMWDSERGIVGLAKDTDY